jgi:acyl dehydratase
MNQLYYEDLHVGREFETDSYQVTEDEIVDFASKYDPQQFHLKEEATDESVFEALTASGLHTLAISNTLIVDAIYSDLNILGGRGIDRLRLPNPLFAQDEIQVTAEVVQKRPSESHPSRGYVDFLYEGYEVGGVKKITFIVLSIVGRSS